MPDPAELGPCAEISRNGQKAMLWAPRLGAAAWTLDVAAVMDRLGELRKKESKLELSAASEVRPASGEVRHLNAKELRQFQSEMGCPPLLLACRAAGLMVDQARTKDATADEVSRACENASTIIEQFVVQGANLQAVDDQGNSALHIVSKHGAPQLLSVLLRLGANPDCRNNAGESPEVIARRMRTTQHITCAEVLKAVFTAKGGHDEISKIEIEEQREAEKKERAKQRKRERKKKEKEEMKAKKAQERSQKRTKGATGLDSDDEIIDLDSEENDAPQQPQKPHDSKQPETEVASSDEALELDNDDEDDEEAITLSPGSPQKHCSPLDDDTDAEDDAEGDSALELDDEEDGGEEEDGEDEDDSLLSDGESTPEEVRPAKWPSSDFNRPAGYNDEDDEDDEVFELDRDDSDDEIVKEEDEKTQMVQSPVRAKATNPPGKKAVEAREDEDSKEKESQIRIEEIRDWWEQQCIARARVTFDLEMKLKKKKKEFDKQMEELYKQVQVAKEQAMNPAWVEVRDLRQQMARSTKAAAERRFERLKGEVNALTSRLALPPHLRAKLPALMNVNGKVNLLGVAALKELLEIQEQHNERKEGLMQLANEKIANARAGPSDDEENEDNEEMEEEDLAYEEDEEEEEEWEEEDEEEWEEEDAEEEEMEEGEEWEPEPPQKARAGNAVRQNGAVAKGQGKAALGKTQGKDRNAMLQATRPAGGHKPAPPAKHYDDEDDWEWEYEEDEEEEEEEEEDDDDEMPPLKQNVSPARSAHTRGAPLSNSARAPPAAPQKGRLHMQGDQHDEDRLHGQRTPQRVTAAMTRRVRNDEDWNDEPEEKYRYPGSAPRNVAPPRKSAPRQTAKQEEENAQRSTAAKRAGPRQVKQEEKWNDEIEEEENARRFAPPSRGPLSHTAQRREMGKGRSRK